MIYFNAVIFDPNIGEFKINLLPNFEVELGAVFLAEIEGCFGLLKTEEVRKNE